MDSSDFTAQFIDAMRQHDCGPANPSDVIADDVMRRYKVKGDKEPNARYQLKITDGFAVGWFHYFKRGETINWHSKIDRKLSKEDKDKFKREIEAANAQKEIERKAENEAAAIEAESIWQNAREDDHPYLQKKQVSSEGTRVGTYTDKKSGKTHKNILIIPIFKNGAITSLQLIWPNGFKMFLEGGDVKGGFFPLTTKEESKATITICEGMATGKSVRAATGLPVVVAFNAGNLEAVALLMRQRYPEAKIIICADNDQWTIHAKNKPEGVDAKKMKGDDKRWQEWRERKFLWNPGLEKAQQAGVKAGTHVIFPDIASDDPEKRTDFNDLQCSEGIEAVANRILIVSKKREETAYDDSFDVSAYDEQIPPDWHNVPPEAYENDERRNEAEFESLYVQKAVTQKDDSWKEQLYYKEDGTIKGNSLKNAKLIIQNHDDFAGMFCFDEFSKEKVVTRCPPWDKKEYEFQARTLRDEDVTNLAMALETRGINLNLQNLRKVLDAVVMDEKRNPAREYFSRLVWDKQPRLNTWLRDYCGAVRDNPEYIAAVGRKWLTAAVNRIFDPGCQFDHILILEGPQGISKSSALREMATFHGRAYFDDTIKASDLPYDKTVPKLQGVIIIELAEMTGFKKMSAEEARQVITTRFDKIVPKYSNEPVKMPRQFVFAGTTNLNGAGYLDDPTGNRRYWPVYCTKIDLAALKNDKEQLWAEAVQLYKDGEELWLKGDLYKKAEEAQGNRSMIHPWTYEIRDLVKGQSHVTPEQIWEKLGIIDRTKRNKQTSEEIAKIMTVIGFEHRRGRINGEREYGWFRLADEVAEIELGSEFEEIPFA